MGAVPIPQRDAVRELVQAHPGRRAVELSSLCGSAVLRAWLPVALRDLRETCVVDVDDRGRYWPT